MAVALCLASAPLPLHRAGISTTPNVRGTGALITASPKLVRLSSHWNPRVNYAVLAEAPVAAAGDFPKFPPTEIIVDPGFLLVNEHQSSLPKEVAMDYLRRILTSKVYDIAIESPLQRADRLYEKSGVNYWMKREDLQPVFSFKLRGAYNMMSNLSEDQLKRGVITASAGNHAQGVALSASTLRCQAAIVMPTTAPQIKKDAVTRLGGDYVKLDLSGQTFDEAQAHALERSEKENLVYIPPFDAEDVLLGQGTIAMEIVKQMGSRPIDAVFVPIGGGGIVSGIAAYIKTVNPAVKVIGVEPSNANSMAIALKHNQRIELTDTDTIADGVAVRVIGEKPFEISRVLIDGVVLVSDAAIAGSIKDVFDENRTILEPSGAVALAGAQAYCKYYNIKSGNFVTVMSGANMDFEKIPNVVDLAEIGRGKEALLATVFPDKQGSLKQFFELLGSVNISEFSYRGDPNRDSALILYKIGIDSPSQLYEIIKKLNDGQFQTINLSGNGVVHDHLKNTIGGSAKVENELLSQFVLPEKPGALKELLDKFSPHYNISMLNYRYDGGINGKVLVGLQVPPAQEDKFHDIAEKHKCPYRVHSDNEGFNFLHAF